MSVPRTLRRLPGFLVAVALLLTAQPQAAQATSGSITNVHAVGGEVEATYSVDFTDCGEASCSWYPYALQYPTSQVCSPGGSHSTWVGPIRSADGQVTETDRFYPAYTEPIRVCLFAHFNGEDFYIADAVFVPTSSISGSITNVHAIPEGKGIATYTTNFDNCVLGFCGWYPHAWKYPASEQCRPGGSHNLAYVGDYHSESGTEVTTDDFSPSFEVTRLCLYARQGEADHFIAEAVYYRTPSPTRRVRFTVGDQAAWFDYPRSCVPAGRKIRLRVGAKTKNALLGKRPSMRIRRVVFWLDRSKKVDKRASWEAGYPTTGMVPGSRHVTKTRIVFRQRRGNRVVVRTIKRSFRICGG